jgi:hypothetical protein
MSARKQCSVLLALETKADLLKPSEITRLKIKIFYNIPTECICVFRTDLRTNIDFFNIH